jgi:hypothetical protein
MRGATPPLPQYAFMTWYSVKAQGQLYPLPLYLGARKNIFHVPFITQESLKAFSKCVIHTTHIIYHFQMMVSLTKSGA